MSSCEHCRLGASVGNMTRSTGLLIQGLKGPGDPGVEVEASDQVPEAGKTKSCGQTNAEDPGETVSCDALEGLFIVFSESPMSHASLEQSSSKGRRGGEKSGTERSGGHKRATSLIGSVQATVAVSSSFSNAATVTCVQSLKETEQRAYDTLSMSRTEKDDINNLIIEKLEHGKYQFVMLRYVCSRARKAQSIVFDHEIFNHFMSIDYAHTDVHTIDIKKLAAALLPCRGSNLVLRTFTRLLGYLTFIGHECYLTKCTAQAVYRPPPTTLFWRMFQATPEPEAVMEVSLVYNITEAFVARVLDQLRIRRSNMQHSSSGSPPPPLLPSHAPRSLSALVAPKGLVKSTVVSVAYSAPPPTPARLSTAVSLEPVTNAKESDDDDEDDSGSDSIILVEHSDSSEEK